MSDRSPGAESIGLWAQIREDRRSHVYGIWSPGFQVLAVHRFGVWARSLPSPLRIVLDRVYRMLSVPLRNIYGIELPATVEVGRQVVLGHQSGIVIHPLSVLGDRCIIRHNVSIAAVVGSDDPRWAKQAPRLGNDVRVGAGAMIMGDITIGDGARIGPNVVVTTNIPAGAVVAVEPPRVLRPRSAVDAS